jgi:hypothetical protein
MGKKISAGRRNFLKVSAAGAASLAIASKVETIFSASSAASPATSNNKWPGRVVINFNKAAFAANVANATVIKQMVDDAILLLTGQTTIGAAWQSIFPSTLTATSKIAIKIPICFLSNDYLTAPHWSSVKAITDGLQQMTFNGTAFPAANITIYDLIVNKPIATSGPGTFASAQYTAANFPGITILKDTAIDGGDGALNNHVYAASLKNANFLINVFGPRGHNMPPTGSGFTLGFKNHFGTYSDPWITMHANGSGMWTAQTAQNLIDINCTGPVYTKTVLVVCSGIYGTNEGNQPTVAATNYGPYAHSIDNTIAATASGPTTIIMSTDPISVEMQAIKMMRLNSGGAYATANMPPYLQAAAGLTASGFTKTYNIGTIDESKMDIRPIKNGVSTPVLNPVADPINASQAGIVAHHINGHNTFIEFMLPQEHVGKEAIIEIYDVKGALVRKLSRKVLGVRNNLSWDEKSERGALVSKGTYIAQLISSGKRASAPFTIVR